MEHAILWCGFLGAWLLVAGPVYQASLELREEEFERDKMEAMASSVPPPPPLSAWWWLLPPVRLLLAHRRNQAHQQAMIEQMPADDLRAAMSFMNKATGWLLVGLGGSFIATKETYELLEGNEWPTWLLALIVPVMLLLSVAYTIARSLREAQALHPELLEERRRQRQDARAAKAPKPDA